MSFCGELDIENGFWSGSCPVGLYQGFSGQVPIHLYTLISDKVLERESAFDVEILGAAVVKPLKHFALADCKPFLRDSLINSGSQERDIPKDTDPQ